MVCMVADYIENGVSHYNSFIALMDDKEKAVNVLYLALSQSGKQVAQITVIPGEHTMAELEQIAEEGIRSGETADSYLFEGFYLWTGREAARFS